jgi:hypothetical protein
MFALRQIIFQPTPVRFKPRVKKSIVKSYYGLSYDNSRKLEKVHGNDLFHVLAFHRAGHEEGIYSITERDENDHSLHSIVAFLTFDDAYRYKTLLEAEMDSYHPYIQFASRYELDYACRVGGYQCLVVNEGALVTPPMKTVKLTDWEIRESLMNGNWTVAPKPENPREQ